MKKILQVIFSFIAIISIAQTKEAIKFRGNVTNYNQDNTYKYLTVIDQREDKQIGTLPFGDKKEMREVVFPTTPANDFGNWYTKANYQGGNYEFVLILKRLKLSVGETVDKKTDGKMDFSAQTFLKDGDKYHFLYKKDTVFAFNNKEVSELMVKNIPTIYSIFIRKSYDIKPTEKAVSFDDLKDYETLTKNNYEAFKNDNLKDGIYLDHHSFFNQTPEQGNYTLEINNKGDVTRAVKEENGKKDKISANKMYAYVDKGKAYKKTFSGFFEIQKDAKGYFILANRGYLFPVQSNSTFGMFGLIGGVAGAIEQGARQNKMKKDGVENIYLDPLTGEYDFSEE
ncbi:hypothetical protein [Chryseobacterium sp. MMS23-Vi53]|uniref:hypothetical protein n=1 Tax=Chryseobacterium sp. MMS23-Vi53 TaxID=3386644 RepID=UPI0039EAAFC6